jgi:hypothetical protein
VVVAWWRLTQERTAPILTVFVFVGEVGDGVCGLWFVDSSRFLMFLWFALGMEWLLRRRRAGGYM